MAKRRVVILTPDRVAPRHAGIAMRHLGVARALARRGFEVELASTDPDSEWDESGFGFSIVSDPEVGALVAGADACLLQGAVLRILPSLARCDVPLVIDLVCPIFLENLERYRGRADEQARHVELLDVFHDALLVGDHFVCGNERQRHYWLGMLTALGRVTPAATLGDPALDGFIGLLSHGLESKPPVASGSLLAELVPDLRADDVIGWWGGGLWDWLDSETPVRAAAALAAERAPGAPRVRLLFTGLRRPQNEDRWTVSAERTRTLAEELGVLGAEVVFADGWVAAESLPDLLAEVHVGLSAHGPSLETTFSLRTRFWTYVWGGLPVIVSQGDHVSEVVRERGLGAAVGMGDVAGWTAALASAADSEWRARCAAAARELAPELTWERAVDGLAQRVERGLSTRPWAQRRAGLRGRAGPLASLSGNVRKFGASLAEEGVGSTLRRSVAKLSPRSAPRPPRSPRAPRTEDGEG